MAAVCLEDKLFPKTNSFIGEHQPLADVDEFCGKIKAGKDSATEPDFSIVARVEALIAGRGLDEALRRAEAYHAAGADAILIHSKRQTADEILAFAAEWGGRAPLVIVPTMYYATPADAFRKAGISVVIWANHNLRASISAMREVSRRIRDEESLVGVEGAIASVRDVFALAGNWELEEAERRYLGPAARRAPRHRHRRLARRRAGAAHRRAAEVHDRRARPAPPPPAGAARSGSAASATSPSSAATGRRRSTCRRSPRSTTTPTRRPARPRRWPARSTACKGPCVVSYGDILFRRHLLDALLAAEGDVVVAVDALQRSRADAGPRAGDGPGRLLPAPHRRLSRGRGAGVAPPHRERPRRPPRRTASGSDWPSSRPRGAALVAAELEAMRADGSLARASLLEMLSRLIAAGHPIGVVYVLGGWLDVDDAFDLARARNFT